MIARVLSAAVLVPLVLAAVAAGNPWWGLAAALVALLAVREQLALAAAAGTRTAPFLAYPLTGVLALRGLRPDLDIAGPALALAFLAAYAWQITSRRSHRSLADWSCALALPIGVGVLAGYAVALRGLPDGLAWTALILALVWTNDTAAYLGGRALGHTPFFGSVSPHKTVEGALLGGLATVAVGVSCPAIAARLPDLFESLAGADPRALGILALSVAVLAPLGDLSQSYLKRLAGAKDSGQLIPGHGGVLDRVDSFAFATAVVYYAALLLAGGP